MAKPLELRVDSKQWVYATVTVDHDITLATFMVALPKANVTPAPADFKTAETVSVTSLNGKWTARYRIMVGPGGTIVPTTGLFDFTTKVTDNPEAPVEKNGQVRITAT